MVSLIYTNNRLESFELVLDFIAFWNRISCSLTYHMLGPKIYEFFYTVCFKNLIFTLNTSSHRNWETLVRYVKPFLANKVALTLLNVITFKSFNVLMTYWRSISTCYPNCYEKIRWKSIFVRVINRAKWN